MISLPPFTAMSFPAFTMDPGKRPAGDASSGGRSTRRHVTRAGSSSGGGYRRRLPPTATAELVPLLDVASAVALEIELERLRRYLEVSQATLKVVEQEMQVVRDQQLVADSWVAGEFSLCRSSLMNCICSSHSLRS
jgi:hypothetical protein